MARLTMASTDGSDALDLILCSGCGANHFRFRKLVAPSGVPAWTSPFRSPYDAAFAGADVDDMDSK